MGKKRRIRRKRPNIRMQRKHNLELKRLQEKSNQLDKEKYSPNEVKFFLTSMLSAIILICYSALSIKYELVFPVTGAILSFIGFVSLFSSSTPIGKALRLEFFFGENILKRYFNHLGYGVRNFALVSVVIGIYLITISENFLTLILLSMSASFTTLTAILLLSVLIMRDGTSLINSLFLSIRQFAHVYVICGLLLITIIGVPQVSRIAIERNQLDSMYSSAKSSPIFHDGLIKSSDQLSDYEEMYRSWFDVTVRTSELALLLRHTKSKLSPWGEANWEVDGLVYSLGQKEWKRISDYFGLELNNDFEYKKITYEEVYSIVEKKIKRELSSHERTNVLASTLKNARYRKIFEFRQAWKNFEVVTPKPSFNIKRKFAEGTLNNTKLGFFKTTQYISAKAVQPFISDLSKLSVSLRLVVHRVIFWLNEVKFSLGVIVLVISSFFSLFLLSMMISKYNRKHDPKSDSSLSVFLVFLGSISLALSIVTL